ncbi:MAG TPA: NAD-dependent deacylase [Desulfatiglandales bacterium]|nr:NAD-dependent deacylase [Desulfatiglandales bacterium]
MRNNIEGLRKIIASVDRLRVLTGAGISAESGVPTFRGAGGIWRNFGIADVATPEAFARNPELVWEFYNWRRDLISNVHCNPGHKALAYLENHIKDFTLITQNVDGLHREAGSQNLLEIHGNLWDVKCTECGLIITDRSRNMGRLPKCAKCGGLLRPNVVWFGESLDPDILGKALDAAGNCDLMLIIGTSGTVQPAASFAFEAKSRGSLLAEINIEETPQSRIMDFVLTGESGKILPMFVEGLK